MLLGVNIDHIAVLKQARMVHDPDPLHALYPVMLGGADQITIHLREDRRHITDYDAARIIENSPLPVNLECSINPEIIQIACDLKPHRVTLVPENREEVTTEGGLDVIGMADRVKTAVETLLKHDIDVSLFVEPDEPTLDAVKKSGATMAELHTGRYANLYAMAYSNLPRTPHTVEAFARKSRKELETMCETERQKIHLAADYGEVQGLFMAAGHGLNYYNVESIVSIGSIKELNIGQSIVARSVFVGIERAVAEMAEKVK